MLRPALVCLRGMRIHTRQDPKRVGKLAVPCAARIKAESCPLVCTYYDGSRTNHQDMDLQVLDSGPNHFGIPIVCLSFGPQPVWCGIWALQGQDMFRLCHSQCQRFRALAAASASQKHGSQLRMSGLVCTSWNGCGWKPLGSHFGVGAPRILVCFSWDSDVHLQVRFGFWPIANLWEAEAKAPIVSAMAESAASGAAGPTPTCQGVGESKPENPTPTPPESMIPFAKAPWEGAWGVGKKLPQVFA